jgi:outer membrane lipopolysaccharide assembly protein LptE/RlpB
MLKKTILITFFLIITSCGYEPIHSQKNLEKYNFSIKSVNFEGDRDINLRLKQKLNNYIQNKKDKAYILDIKTVNEKTIIAKDASGNPTNFENFITVTVNVLIEKNFKRNFKIKRKFKYSNNEDKFELKNYERQLKNNSSDSIAEELIFDISNIQ